MAIEALIPPLSELTMSDAVPTRGIILYETANLIGSTTINGALYGIAFALYILCVRSLYPQFKNADQQRRALFTFAYTSVVAICGLIFVALVTQITQLSYVVHRKFPGGPTAYEAEYLFTQPIGITIGAFSVVVDLLTLGVQIWRLWVIWSTTQYAIVVMILPLLLFLSFAAMDIISSILEPIFPNVFTQEKVGAIANAVIGLQLGFTAIVTALVITRLMLVRRRHIKLMGASEMSRQYTGIAAMLIESYALESAWSLAAVILNATSSPLTLLFTTCNANINIIAYLLVVYRVSIGRAWDKQTEQRISALRWNHSTGSATVGTIETSRALPSNNVVVASLPTSHLSV